MPGRHQSERPVAITRCAHFFQAEARIGQEGRTVYIWWWRDERPPGLCDKRFTFASSSRRSNPASPSSCRTLTPI
jgi:hypothetical protein